MTARPWRVTVDGVILSVRLTPKGGRDALEGIETRSDGQVVLKARVRALPQDGEANAALIALICQKLEISARNVSLNGATARLKRISIAGDGPALAARLEKLISPRSAP